MLSSTTTSNKDGKILKNMAEIKVTTSSLSQGIVSVYSGSSVVLTHRAAVSGWVDKTIVLKDDEFINRLKK